MTQASVPGQKVAALRKTSLVDFPPHLSAAVFFRGCNLRCPYCYNTELLLSEPNPSAEFVSTDEIIGHLKKRRGVLKALAVSGGEALLNPAAEIVMREAKSLGYKIKLDTNGTCPERLEAVLLDSALSPDYVAMDIKTSKKKLWMLLGSHECRRSAFGGVLSEDQKEELSSLTYKKIRKSIEILSSLPATNREWRTVLVPPLVDADDIAEMAAMLPMDASWYFTSFAQEHCLDPSYQSIAPYSGQKERELVLVAKKIIPGAEYR